LQAATTINSQQQSIGRSKQHNSNSNQLSPAINTRNQQLSAFSSRQSTAANNCQQSTINNQSAVNNSQQLTVNSNNQHQSTTISNQQSAAISS
jgi:hypothetical protein